MRAPFAQGYFTPNILTAEAEMKPPAMPAPIALGIFLNTK